MDIILSLTDSIMWDLERANQGQAERTDPLTKELHIYSDNEKIRKREKARARNLVEDYVEDQVMKYCRENSPLPIKELVYTGSFYERLKTEAYDEVDIMVVLEIKPGRPCSRSNPKVVVENHDTPAGFVRFKAMEGSKLQQYVSEGYIDPERFRNGWAHSLVHRAANGFNSSSHNSDIRLDVYQHGPAVQLDITEKRTDDKLLSVDLVPCLETEDGEYFVPKPNRSNNLLSVPSPDRLLWRQSFSLKEKDMLKCMDKDDHGCRHVLFRIVKTFVKRERTTFGKLNSYHLKTAFMHYIEENRDNWAGKNSLGDHWLGFLGKLQGFLENETLPHFEFPVVNLLDHDGINPVVARQMANRLKKIRAISEQIRTSSTGRRLLQADPDRMLAERHYTFPPLRIPGAEGVTQNEPIPHGRMPGYDLCDMMQIDEENRYSCFRILEDPEDSDDSMRNLFSAALKSVLWFLLRLLLGLVLLSFSILFFFSWLVGVGFLLLLVWLALTHLG